MAFQDMPVHAMEAVLSPGAAGILEQLGTLEQLGRTWKNLEELGTTQKHLRHVPTLFQRVLNFARESKNESFKKPSTNLQPELSRLAEPNLPMSCLLWKVTPRQSLPPTAKGSRKIAKHCCKKNTNLPSIASRVSDFSFLSVLLSSTLNDITISAAACRVV